MSNPLSDLSQKFTQWSSRIEQNKDELEAELHRWKGYKEEYEALGKQLETLADETSRPAMIPFGNLAFMPGKLIHTNEITVYLGDQYYVERSTKQALGILNRRKEGVDENLNLVQAQWNAIKAKSDSVSSNLFPSGDGVNEEGLPIMEIREEIPMSPEEDVSTNTVAPIDHPSSSSITTTTPEVVAPSLVEHTDHIPDEASTSNSNDLMAMLDALEQEEEEEERIKQQQTFEQQLSFYEPDDAPAQTNYDDEEDLEDLYDTEVADNIFDHFEDDEEYATQGVVDQEDMSTREDLDNEDTDRHRLDEAGNDMDHSPLGEPIKDVVAERLDTPVASVSSPPSVVAESEPSTTQSAGKKVSKFKKLQLEKQNIETTDTVTTSTVVTDVETTKSRSTKPKFKVLKQGERKRKLEQPRQISPPASSPESIPQVMSSKPKDVVSSMPSAIESQVQEPPSPPVTTLSPPPEQPKKKVSKFKQFQEQQRQTQGQQLSSGDHHAEHPKKHSPKAAHKGTPIAVPSRDIPSKQKATTTITTNTTTTTTADLGSDDGGAAISGRKKVSWESTTSVREHDRLSAPQTDPRDTYDKPLKEAHNPDQPQSMQHTIRSPSDIFRVVKQHQPEMEEDGYPALDSDVSSAAEAAAAPVDLRELASAISLSDPEPMWRPNYEVDEDKLPTTQRPWRPSTLVQSKSKLDTNTMRGVVMEREAEDLDLDEVEDDMDFKEIKSSYQKQRQGMLATMGGLSFDPKPEFEVFDEELPLPSAKGDQDDTDIPRKMSRFKAARMGLASDQ